MDILVLNITYMTKWLSIILNPEMISIPLADSHLFQIFFAVIAYDHIWFLRNKAHHEDLVPNALVISAYINMLVLEHYSARHSSLSTSSFLVP
jgi:hypothetical protein